MINFYCLYEERKSSSYTVCVYEILTHGNEQFPELSGFSFSFFSYFFIIFFIKILPGFPLVTHQWRSGNKIQRRHYLLWLSITSASILNKYIDSLCLLVYVFLLLSFSPSHQQVPAVFPPTFPRLITVQGICTEAKHEFEMWFLITGK